MGNCVSSTYEEPEAEKFPNPINDHYFINTIDIKYLQALGRATNSLVESKLVLEIIRDDIRAVSILSETLKALFCSPFKPKLIIEVQRARNIKYKGSCICNPRPVVEIVYFPIGVQRITHATSARKPFWYEIFVHNQSLADIQFILFRLYQRKDKSENILLGVMSVDVLDIMDQEVYGKWIYFDGVEGEAKDTALYVRIQMITQPEHFYQEKLIWAKEAKLELKSAYLKLKIQHSKNNIDSEDKVSVVTT